MVTFLLLLRSSSHSSASSPSIAPPCPLSPLSPYFDDEDTDSSDKNENNVSSDSSVLNFAARRKARKKIWQSEESDDDSCMNPIFNALSTADDNQAETENELDENHANSNYEDDISGRSMLLNRLQDSQYKSSYVLNDDKIYVGLSVEC